MRYQVTVNGQVYDVVVETVDSKAAPAIQPQSAPVAQAPVAAAAAPSTETTKPAPAAPAPTGEGQDVESPMPGKILRILVAQGASVQQGDVLMILEAMKMENEILAPCAGTLTYLGVNEGSSVNTGDILARLA